MGNIWKGLALLAAIGLLLGTSAQAGTVLIVSDCNAPDVVDGDHNDDEMVTYLEGLGYTVDTSGMGKAMREGDNGPWGSSAGSADKLQALNDADLILVSRRTSSGSYDNDRKGWNELETPLVLMSGYLTRGGGQNKWGWTVGASGNAATSVETMDIDAGQTAHPFVAGVTGPVQLFDWPGDPAAAPKAVYLPNKDGTSDPVSAATVVGTFDGRTYLMDIPAGTDLDPDNGSTDKYGVTGARRAFMGHWGYDDSPTGTNGSDGGPSDFADYITADFEAVLGNAISTLIPEPGTVTMLIAGLLGLALYGWRRRK